MASRTPCQADAGSVVQAPLMLGFASRRRWLRWALWGSAGLGAHVLVSSTATAQPARASKSMPAKAVAHCAEADAFLDLTQHWAEASAYRLQAALATGELSTTRLLGMVAGRLRLLGRHYGLDDTALDHALPIQLWSRARQLQLERRKQGPRSSWHGLPVLIQLDAIHSPLSHHLEQAGALLLPLSDDTLAPANLFRQAAIPLLVLSSSSALYQPAMEQLQGDLFHLTHGTAALLMTGSTTAERLRLLTELGLSIQHHDLNQATI